MDLSEEVSTEVNSSSDENDNDISTFRDWVDNYKYIFDFRIDLNSSGIKINILESAKNASIKIFKKFRQMISMKLL